MKEVFTETTELEMTEIVDTWVVSYRKNWSLFDDARPCLRRLSGRDLGIITNGDLQQQFPKLVDLGLINQFKVIIYSGTVEYAKPDARIFQEACLQMGCKPEDAVYVGDNLDHDARAAAKVGMRGIWLNRLRKEKVTDVEVIKSLDELVI